MTEQNKPQPSKDDDPRRTFTVRETLRSKYGYDAAAKIIRRCFDLAEANKR